MKFYESAKFLALLFAGALTFTACGDDEDNPNDPGRPPAPLEAPAPGEAMSPAQQKERLDKVANEFMSLTPASDFQAISDLTSYIDRTYNDERFSWDEVDSWGKDVWNSLKKPLHTTDTVIDKDESYGDRYIYQNVYNNYHAVILASNFTGHFTAQGYRWVYAKASDLQFHFTDQSGQPCTLSVVASGNVKKVNAVNIDEWKDYDYEYTPNFVHTDYYDRINCTIGVPERIVVKLTQGGSEVIKVEVNIDLNSIKDEQFDLGKSALSLKANVKLNNGYSVSVDRVAYGGNGQQASATTKIMKGNVFLASVSASTTLSGIPSCNLDAFISGEVDEDAFESATGTDAYVKVDVLGKVQFEGWVSDIRKLSDYLEMADDNDENEGQFKSYINQANALMNLYLFYDNKGPKQADILLDSFVEGDYYGSYWYCEPVLKFYDETSYSTFEAFFNDRDFKNVVDAFEQLMKDFDRLF